LHKYIATRISRQANTHTTIKYPLKYAKKHPPRKESKLPTIIEKRDSFCPEKSLEGAEITAAIETAAECLNRKQKEIIKLYFGLTGDAPKSITKVCKKMKISRVNAVEILNNALDILRQNIQI
jgi:DNA-directed RNA polymerase sigma subunit (sigma70/sigma32)